MNSPATPLNPNTILYGFEPESAALNDGSFAKVRVIIVPVRHRVEMFNLFANSREAEILKKSVQINLGTEEKTDWQPVTPEWVDSLDDPSHEKLYEVSQRLNFQRAIKAAEREIAKGTELLPMQKAIVAQTMKPIKEELTSLMSSLTSSLAGAASAKTS